MTATFPSHNSVYTPISFPGTLDFVMEERVADLCVSCAAKYRIGDIRVNMMSCFACRIGFCVKVAVYGLYLRLIH